MKLNCLEVWCVPRVQLGRSALGTGQGREKQGQASGESEGSALHPCCLALDRSLFTCLWGLRKLWSCPAPWPRPAVLCN